MTQRYKEALQVQQQAKKKYRAKNITTIGHSQGGYQAQILGANSKEIITLNKATRPQEFILSLS
jgi:putative lipase involved disintegration of autophagic bodies